MRFERLGDWLVSCEKKLDLLPKLKLALAKHEGVIYPFFVLLVVIFFLLLPRASRFPCEAGPILPRRLA
jgi:hypothetical protein